MSEATMSNDSRNGYKEVSVKKGPIPEKFKFYIAARETRVSEENMQVKNADAQNGGSTDTTATANNDKKVAVSSVIITNLPDIVIDAERYAQVLNDKENYREGSLKEKKANREKTENQTKPTQEQQGR